MTVKNSCPLSGQHKTLLDELFVEPLKEMNEAFSKFQDMIETTLDLEQVCNFTLSFGLLSLKKLGDHCKPPFLWWSLTSFGTRSFGFTIHLFVVFSSFNESFLLLSLTATTIPTFLWGWLGEVFGPSLS